MGRLVRQTPLTALWIAVGVVIAGRLVDLQWHLTHDEFEGAGDQVRAHLVVWIGVLLVLLTAASLVRQGTPLRGVRLSLAGAVAYIPIAVWHFVEHASGNDPNVAHVLLGVTDLMIIGGAVIATLVSRRTRLPHPQSPELGN